MDFGTLISAGVSLWLLNSLIPVEPIIVMIGMAIWGRSLYSGYVTRIQAGK